MSKVSTSLRVFRSFIRRDEETDELDVSGIISRECFLEWLHIKGAKESDTECRRFHRTLSNHVTGVVCFHTTRLNQHLTPKHLQDGRIPFSEEEEIAILALFRKRLAWPCFPPHLADLNRGYRSRGYHEKQRNPSNKQALLTAPTTTSSTAAASSSYSTLPTSFPLRDFHMSSTAMDQILQALSVDDGMYLQRMGAKVVQNFAGNFGLEEWKNVVQIFRFMILAKTSAIASTKAHFAAYVLCNRFSVDDQTQVLVFDLAAKRYEDRILAQNAYSKQMFGNLMNNATGRIAHEKELFGVVVAVGASFHNPGNFFWVFNQRNYCDNGQSVRMFDMCYYCDPASYLMVLFGKLSEPPPGGGGGMAAAAIL